MTKQELIDAMASKTGMSKIDSQKALQAILDSIISELKRGGTIQLVGFGSFSVDVRREREGRNPQTGKKIILPEKKIAKWKPSKNILD
ncbi:MAG: HU family DNA-binding protein [Bacilli bacterium]|nr:HU family DNA-binding protein [Bacilli bacterium]